MSFEQQPEIRMDGEQAMETELERELIKLREQIHAEMKIEEGKRLEENPTPSEEELHLAAFKEWIEPQCRDAVVLLNKKGYGTKSSGFYGEHNDFQAVDGDFAIDEETAKKLNEIGAQVLRGTELGVPENRLVTQIRFYPEDADPERMKEKWDKIASILPQKEGSVGICDRAEEFCSQYAPDRLQGLISEREEYYRKLKKEIGIETEDTIENSRETIENGILKSSIFEKFKDRLGVGATTKELNRIIDRENERIRITAPQDRFDKRFDQEDPKRRKDKISAARIIINALRRIAPGMDPHNIQKTALEHGNNIAVINEEYLAKDKKERARVLADGMITNLKEIPLMVVAADCAPVGIYDPTNEAIGTFHSGWKGTLKQISRKGVEALCKNYGSKPEDLLVVIGPRAGGEDFEVDQKVYDEFIGAKNEEENPIYTPEEVATFFKERPEKLGFYFLDTGLAIKTSLLKAGATEEHIQISGYSTMSGEGNKLFPSERMEGQEKRDSFAFLMALKEQH
jgi:YfiH family protein